MTLKGIVNLLTISPAYIGALAGQQKYMDYLMGRSLPSIGVLGPFSNARL